MQGAADDMEISAPPQFSRQNSAGFNASVNDFLRDLGSAGIGEAPAIDTPQPATPAAGEIQVQVPQDDSTGKGGNDDDDEEEEEEEEGEEEDEGEEDEAAELARAAAFIKKKRGIIQQAGGIGLQCNDVAAKAIVDLEQELLAEKITNVAELKAALNLNDGDKLTATLVRNLIKEKKRAAYDAALPSSKRAKVDADSQVRPRYYSPRMYTFASHSFPCAQDYDPFTAEEDDDSNDPDHYGSPSDKKISEMNVKEMEDLLTKKSTDLKMLQREMSTNPTVVVMKVAALISTPSLFKKSLFPPH